MGTGTLKEKSANSRKKRDSQTITPKRNYNIDTEDTRVGIDDKSIATEQFGDTGENRLGLEQVNNGLTQTKPVGIAPINKHNATTVPYVEETEEEKPFSMENWFAEQRKQAQQEKTDAAKMQKYHALSNVFSSIGKLGGAAIGGAVGGNILDSAPKAEEYKQSKGYLDAFEKAKRANDRLRALDNQEFQLAYGKQQREEERAYQAKQKQAEMEYREKQAAIEREWRSEEARITREWNAAVADKNAERQAALQKELLQMKNDFTLRLNNAKGEYDKAIAGLKAKGTEKQIRFEDGRGIIVSKDDFEGLERYLINKKVGDEIVDKDNVYRIMSEHPEIVNGYLKSFGKGFIEPEVEVEKSEEEEVIPATKKNSFWKTVGDSLQTANLYKNVYNTNPNKKSAKKETKKEYSAESDQWASYLE